MTATNTADAVAREAAWLTTSGDGLPALLEASGGPWENVQAYIPRVVESQQRAIYVLRGRARQRRFGGRRTLYSYAFRLVLRWPLQDQQGSAEADQQAFDDAIDLLLQRILGFGGQVFDKTHGGRFLQVGEDPAGQPEVTWEDPERTTASGYLQAEVTYSADDPEINA